MFDIQILAHVGIAGRYRKNLKAFWHRGTDNTRVHLWNTTERGDGQTRRFPHPQPEVIDGPNVKG